MTELDALSFAFLRDHPAEAIRIIEAQSLADSAAFLCGIPARIAGPLLALMQPVGAAQVIGTADAEKAAELLGQESAPTVAAILRHLQPDQRRLMLAALPTSLAVATRMYLGYPEDAVGAWVDPDMLLLPADTTAAAALAQAQSTNLGTDYVLLTHGDQRLVGWISLGAIVQSAGGLSLRSLMKVPVAMIPAQLPLSGAMNHPAWHLTSVLPVVTREQRPLGLLTRDRLERAWQRVARRSSQQLVNDSAAGTLVGAYWHGVASLITAGISALPRVPGISGYAEQDSGR